MTDTTIVKFSLPHVRKAVLSNFSLFTRQREISVEFGEGVFCLAGANGLGKSTFLSALNYGLTGIVPEPQRKFDSVNEYYRDNMKFAAAYFKGRITENDRASAEVKLEFTVGDFLYRISRGIFEPDQLRTFSVVRRDNSAEVIADDPQLSPEEKNQRYKQLLVEHSGLNTFEQYVFIQAFILTFDERRHLLFWDQKVLEQTLFLAFGVQPADAKLADTLRREDEKADSRARNANWQASETRKRIQDIERILEGRGVDVNQEGLVEQHQKMTEIAQQSRRAVDAIEQDLRDAGLQVTEASAEQAMLRAEYSQAYENHVRQRGGGVRLHPVIAATLSNQKCEICGTEGQHVVDFIRRKIDETCCPLCSSQVSAASDIGETITTLRAIDQKLVASRARLDNHTATVKRLQREFKEAKDNLNKQLEELNEFEETNNEILSRIYHSKSPGDDLSYILNTFKTQLERLLREKDEQYAKRDEKRRERNKLQTKLEIRYSEAEAEFVPLFKALATSFLGINLDVQLDTRSSTGVNLILEVNSSTRREDHQLSESQKFFVDIALRMALAQYMSRNQDEVCLFIDTPEGSLDIAYESRAGEMFALFVQDGRSIIMTANINSSQLLQRLAAKCGEERLILCRMTSWTQLSEVQVAEERLFEKAYAEIESAMNSK